MKLEKITDEHEDCSTGYNVVLHITWLMETQKSLAFGRN